MIDTEWIHAICLSTILSAKDGSLEQSPIENKKIDTAISKPNQPLWYKTHVETYEHAVLLISDV